MNSSMSLVSSEDHEKLLEYFNVLTGTRMESESFQAYKKLVNEITKGKELVLRASSSGNLNQERMLASYDEALSILNGNASQGQDQLMVSSSSAGPPDSSLSQSEEPIGSSARSQILPRPFQKKEGTTRSVTPCWTEQVKVSSYAPPDDEYNWRKYGQKDILGSKFPRCYYRCTYHSSQHCLARKQVQRSDDDPSIFEITYRGRHTCMGPPVAPPLAPPAPPDSPDLPYLLGPDIPDLPYLLGADSLDLPYLPYEGGILGANLELYPNIIRK